MQIRIEIAVVKGSHSQNPKFYQNHTIRLLNQCVFTLRCCAPPPLPPAKHLDALRPQLLLYSESLLFIFLQVGNHICRVHTFIKDGV